MSLGFCSDVETRQNMSNMSVSHSQHISGVPLIGIFYFPGCMTSAITLQGETVGLLPPPAFATDVLYTVGEVV